MAVATQKERNCPYLIIQHVYDKYAFARVIRCDIDVFRGHLKVIDRDQL